MTDEQSGIKDHGLLDSALKSPQQSLFGQDAYPSLYEEAAALLELLAQNHTFHNANKRTALICTALFFRYNGHVLRFPIAKSEEDFVVDVVNHRYTVKEMSEILQQNTTKNSS